MAFSVETWLQIGEFLLNYLVLFWGPINSDFLAGKIKIWKRRGGARQNTRKSSQVKATSTPIIPNQFHKFIGKPNRKTSIATTSHKVNGKWEPASTKNIITNKLIETLYNFCFNEENLWFECWVIFCSMFFVFNSTGILPTNRPTKKAGFQMVEYEKPEFNQVFKITLGNSDDWTEKVITQHQHGMEMFLVFGEIRNAPRESFNNRKF